MHFELKNTNKKLIRSTIVCGRYIRWDGIVMGGDWHLDRLTNRWQYSHWTEIVWYAFLDSHRNLFRVVSRLFIILTFLSPTKGKR